MMCRSNYTKHALNPPLLFDLHSDPGEVYALDTKISKYAEILKNITMVSNMLENVTQDLLKILVAFGCS